MTNSQKRQKEFDTAFKVYNGSAVDFHAKSYTRKSVQQICNSGTSLAKGMTITRMLNEGSSEGSTKKSC